MISNFVWYFTALIFCIDFGSIKCDDALLFETIVAKIVQKPSTVDDESANICEKCASACPASDPEDLEYNYKESFGKKVLLLKNIYDESKNMNEIQVPECDKSIQPSVVLNTSKNLIETGYEIHDRKNIIKFLPSDGKPTTLFSLYSSDPNQKPKPWQVLFQYLKSEKKSPPPEENAKNFMWLPVLTINFDVDSLSPKQIEYSTDLGSGEHWTTENCSEFNVGQEFYPDGYHTSLYSPENQRKLLTGVENPPAQSSEVESVSSGEKLECEPTYGCLVQHQIIPSYYFHSQYGKLAICTYLNTVPVWEDIVDRINIVNRYLYTMTQIWKPMNIIAGFYEIFKPSEKYFKKIPVSGQPLYLDQGHNVISVPLVIYKIVEYKVQTPGLQNSINHYFAIILIHNDPTPGAGLSKLCHGDDRLLGWESIENEDSNSGLTYVCRYSASIADKLGLTEDDRARDGGIGLRLDELPTYDAERGRYVYHNAKLEIREKTKELFHYMKLKLGNKKNQN